MDGQHTLVAELGGVVGCTDHREIGCGEESVGCCFGCRHFYYCDLVRGVLYLGRANGCGVVAHEALRMLG